ncbi:MAG: hypothetical protein AAGA10_14935 [Bacteroidota bacterium]
MEFLVALEERNRVLFWFGIANLLSACIMLILSFTRPLEYGGTNAWHKPIKFALSTTILSWSMGWYTGYLGKSNDINVFNWILVITLAFEVIYIGIQAGKGQASHFNQSTPFHSAMFSLMAVAATLATLAVGYIGVRFFTHSFPALPDYYVWSIRLGIILFVIFSFEGFAMGAKLAHTVGGVDGSKGLPFLNWSRVLGDLRVAHFFGMHALQILPLLSWYLIRDVRLTLVAFFLYGGLAVWVLIQALQAKPFL